METTFHRKLLEDTAGLYNCTVDTDCEQVLTLEYCWRCVFMLPPPPSPPPPPPDHHNIAQITPYLVSAVCALGVAFLILTTCAILLRCRLSRRRNSVNSSSSGDSVFLDEDHGPVDHPIWRIVTVGLPQSVIDSITTVDYKKGDGLIEGTDCSVCLTEFEEGDDLRLLPKCSHAFHINCIDTWLRSHKNCPLCRAPVINHSSARWNPNLSDRRSSGSVRIQNPETDESQETEMEQWRIRDHVEGIRIGEIMKNDWGKRAFSDLGENHRFIIEDLQCVRRSISMDASATSKSVVVNVAKPSDEGSSKQESQDSRFSRLMKSSSIGRSLQKGPVSMKRSFSSRIRRSKSHSSSILPL